MHSPERKINRRKALEWLFFTTAGLTLAACAPVVVATNTPTLTKPRPTDIPSPPTPDTNNETKLIAQMMAKYYPELAKTTVGKTIRIDPNTGTPMYVSNYAGTLVDVDCEKIGTLIQFYDRLAASKPNIPYINNQIISAEKRPGLAIIVILPPNGPLPKSK
jgi:hypothetical protein